MLKQYVRYCWHWSSDEAVCFISRQGTGSLVNPVSSNITRFSTPGYSLLSGRLSSEHQHQARHVCSALLCMVSLLEGLTNGPFYSTDA
jgi:hypothetical protein